MGGGGGRGRLSFWPIRTLTDHLKSIFTPKLEIEIASLLTMFCQGTSKKPVQLGKVSW